MEIRKASIYDDKVLQGLFEFIKSLDIDLIRKIGEEEFWEILKICYESEDDRYSYRNCKVIESDKEIQGFYFSYDYDFLLESRKYWENKIIPKYNLNTDDVIFNYNEALVGEYYLDILYVFENSRSEGYGTEMLKNFFETTGYNIKSLNVAEDNPRARKLYESFGMKKECEIEIANHKYYHMVLRNC